MSKLGARRDLIEDTSGAIIVDSEEKPTKSVSENPKRTIMVLRKTKLKIENEPYKKLVYTQKLQLIEAP